MNRPLRIAVIRGDGIGGEVIDAAIGPIEAAAGAAGGSLLWDHLPYGADHYLATGETLPEHAFEHLRDDVDAILLGALGDPRIPGNEHARDILLGLRFRLDLYVNFRPCTLLTQAACPLKQKADGSDWKIDFVIFRENTEGSYLGRGTSRNVGGPDEEQIVEAVHTAPKVERLLRRSFEWAAANDRTLVTVSDKSNAIPGHLLWRRLAREIAEDFPNIELEFCYIDALAMELIRDPERFQIIATSNLFGDILSDLGSQLVGGLGLASSANLHPGKPGLFEPVHGSAPPLVGTDTANPFATMLTGALMLRELGLDSGARLIDAAVVAAMAGGITTPDLGGCRSTSSVGEWVTARISGG